MDQRGHVDSVSSGGESAQTDAELIASVRAGDSEAYGVLFERHHPAALALARQLSGFGDDDGLVSEAFLKVQRVLAGGGGPDESFRAYLLTAVRRLHVDKVRASSRVTLTDDVEKFDRGDSFTDPVVQEFETSAAARAFASLPERWQEVLWHVEIEGLKPAAVAEMLAMTPNSVSALAYRAREGLRLAYLQEHLAEPAAEPCRWVTQRMGGYLRTSLSKDETSKVQHHFDECARCSGVYAELRGMNAHLARTDAASSSGTSSPGHGATLDDASSTDSSLHTQLRDKVQLAKDQAATATQTAPVDPGSTAFIRQGNGHEGGKRSA